MVEVHEVPMGPCHIDQLQPPQVFGNDYGPVGCLSKCASFIKLCMGVMQIDGSCVKVRRYFDFHPLCWDEVDLILLNFLPSTLEHVLALSTKAFVVSLLSIIKRSLVYITNSGSCILII
jgi:hypothetical protein